MKFGNLFRRTKIFCKTFLEWHSITILIWLLFVLVISIGIMETQGKLRRQKESGIECSDGCMSIEVIEISVRGEHHEYLKNGTVIIHLPNCRYCSSEKR